MLFMIDTVQHLTRVLTKLKEVLHSYDIQTYVYKCIRITDELSWNFTQFDECIDDGDRQPRNGQRIKHASRWYRVGPDFVKHRHIKVVKLQEPVS